MNSPLPASAIDAPLGPAAANGRQRGNLQPPDLVALVDGLEQRLATQPVIEQSKGILMGHFGIDPDSAFDVLRRWSSHTNLKVRDLSRLLVTTVTANPPGDPGRPTQELVDLIACLNARQVPATTTNKARDNGSS